MCAHMCPCGLSSHVNRDGYRNPVPLCHRFLYHRYLPYRIKTHISVPHFGATFKYNELPFEISTVFHRPMVLQTKLNIADAHACPDPHLCFRVARYTGTRKVPRYSAVKNGTIPHSFSTLEITLLQCAGLTAAQCVCAA